MSSKPKAKTLAEFRNEYDPQVVIENRITAALSDLLKIGREAYDIESDFQERAKLTQKQIAEWRPKFAAHIVEVPRKNRDGAPKRFWFADAKVAAVALTPKKKP